MSHWQTLADALLDEDRVLRRRLASVPPELLGSRGPDDGLSFQETLGHIAFWDDFTVRFFTTKLDSGGDPPSPPADFARVSEEAVAEAASRPFTEVLALYLEATGALVGFISRHWERLTEKEQRDFWVPLKHRRHHRIALFRTLDALQDGEEDEEIATGA